MQRDVYISVTMFLPIRAVQSYLCDVSLCNVNDVCVALNKSSDSALFDNDHISTDLTFYCTIINTVFILVYVSQVR